MIISRCTAVAALAAFSAVLAAGSIASADQLISGIVVHVSDGGRSTHAGDIVRVNNGKRWFTTRTNSDGSYLLRVADSDSKSYGLYILSPDGRQQYAQYRVQAGPQPAYVVGGS